jgi:hypothetical protein
MDTKTVVLALASATILAVIHALDKKLPRFASLSDGLRVVLASALGVVSSIVDVMTQNSELNIGMAALNALTVAGPSFVVILVSWLAGGGDDGKGGKSTVEEVKEDAKEAKLASVRPMRLSLHSISRSLKSLKLVTCVLMVSMMTGCAGGLSPVLNEVLTDVSDAAQILNVIRSVATIFFLSHPNQDAQVKVEEALAKTQLALDGALRATKGAKELTEKDNNAAFNDFRTAYEDLTRVLKVAGISDSGGKLSAKRDGTSFSLPTPMAMKH